TRVVKVPQEDLAMMLALSRQTINQILRQFEMQGALKLRYAEIEIVDAKKLAALADVTESDGTESKKGRA
ncbi:helix-turn-helix domain-containing protein, partial [Klebsiella pneumoniae]|uniref:helix-turn-helix domain-containing protein n=2 Tax=Pseudomonadota TaxID=1224 RepID=UPI002DBA75A8